MHLFKIAHLLLGKYNVANVAGCQLAKTLVALVLCQAEIFAIPFVKFPGEFAHGIANAFSDVGECFFNNFLHISVNLRNT